MSTPLSTSIQVGYDASDRYAPVPQPSGGRSAAGFLIGLTAGVAAVFLLVGTQSNATTLYTTGVTAVQQNPTLQRGAVVRPANAPVYTRRQAAAPAMYAAEGQMTEEPLQYFQTVQAPQQTSSLNSFVLLALGAVGGAVFGTLAHKFSAKSQPAPQPIAMMSTAGATDAAIAEAVEAISRSSRTFRPAKPSVFGETLDTLTAAVTEAGYPAFRAKQIMGWLYKRRVDSWDLMTDLPKAMREWLAEEYELYPLTPILDKRSGDETQKILLELQDKSLIETVLIQAPQDDDPSDDPELRKTICVSSQVGCAFGCKFCASGLDGWKRNLLPAEVIAQLMHICRREDPHTTRTAPEIVSFDNVVFMGMGEPLSNYDTLVRVLEIMNAPWGLNFGARRITVSTSGIAPRIRQLADEAVPVRLAISLHGATDEVRNKIMPINKRFPLSELIPAARHFQRKHGRMLTLEFILIEGINDDVSQAEALVEIARDLHAHVNCIPYNVVEGLPWKRPSVRRQDKFVAVLRNAGVSATIRRQKGDAIDAACGQLRLKVEKERELENLELVGA